MNVEKIVEAILKLKPADRARVRQLLEAATEPGENITPPPTGDPPGGPPK